MPLSRLPIPNYRKIMCASVMLFCKIILTAYFDENTRSLNKQTKKKNHRKDIKTRF